MQIDRPYVKILEETTILSNERDRNQTTRRHRTVRTELHMSIPGQSTAHIDLLDYQWNDHCQP